MSEVPIAELVAPFPWTAIVTGTVTVCVAWIAARRFWPRGGSRELALVESYKDRLLIIEQRIDTLSAQLAETMRWTTYYYGEARANGVDVGVFMVTRAGESVPFLISHAGGSE